MTTVLSRANGPEALSGFRGRWAPLRFRLLLTSLLSLLLVYPLANAIPFGERMLHGVAALVLVAGVFSVANHAAVLIAGTVLAVVAVLSDIAVLSGAGRGVLILSLASEALFELLIDAAVLIAVVSTRRVTTDTLAGGLCAYLLTGMAFASVYSIVEVLAPGSYAFPGPTPGGPAWTDFVFFSFTTLTTLGYGDIRPVSDLARSLTSLESILGVFYMAILVARLVSAYEDRSPARAEAESA